MQIGDIVHIDTDNEEWGRVCSDAEVLNIKEDYILVNAFSIRANIIVLPEEICE
jgi:hypothetical protein